MINSINFWHFHNWYWHQIMFCIFCLCIFCISKTKTFGMHNIRDTVIKTMNRARIRTFDGHTHTTHIVAAYSLCWFDGRMKHLVKLNYMVPFKLIIDESWCGFFPNCMQEYRNSGDESPKNIDINRYTWIFIPTSNDACV